MILSPLPGVMKFIELRLLQFPCANPFTLYHPGPVCRCRLCREGELGECKHTPVAAHAERIRTHDEDLVCVRTGSPRNAEAPLKAVWAPPTCHPSIHSPSRPGADYGSQPQRPLPAAHRSVLADP